MIVGFVLICQKLLCVLSIYMFVYTVVVQDFNFTRNNKT